MRVLCVPALRVQRPGSTGSAEREASGRAQPNASHSTRKTLELIPAGTSLCRQSSASCAKCVAATTSKDAGSSGNALMEINNSRTSTFIFFTEYRSKAPWTTAIKCYYDPLMELRWIFAGLASLIHILFFCFESLWWTRPAVRETFRQSAQDAETTKLLAFNQGFYNLFLAAGVILGLVLVFSKYVVIGEVLIAWNCAFMVGAALVLAVTSPKMFRGSILQGLPPAIYLTMTALKHL